MRPLVLLLVLAAAVGCKKAKPEAAPESGPPGPDRPSAISAPERKRGAEACTAYVERLCKCAEQKPELADQCHMKHAKPEALVLAFGVADDPSSSRDSIVRAQKEARTIIARCIEEASQLPSLGCP